MGAFIIMRKKIVVSATLLLAASLSWQANASTFDFRFAGAGVSGTVELTYGAATDGKYPQAFEVTGISGTFSDSNNGLNIVNAPIGPLEPVQARHAGARQLAGAARFQQVRGSVWFVPENNGFLTYDNLFYPGGSPQTASDYPLHGGFLDIYGLLFDIGGGRVVDFWSNGNHRNGAWSIDLRRRGRYPRYGVGLCRWWRVGDSRA